MTIHVTITASGDIALPADVRRRLGVEPGDTLVIEEHRDGVYLRSERPQSEPDDERTRQAALRRAQDFTAQWLKGDSVDQFLAERRAMWGED